jgi:sporulation protein YlmC with PRC-barrel domain
MAMQSTLNASKTETHSLIASDKVEGTPVYRSNGEEVGTIERIMIDKISGKVAYAVMSFGGVMGIGKDYYPMPWNLLIYNPQLEGYEVNIGEEQLKRAPKYRAPQTWDWQNRASSIDDYWGRLS